MITKQNADSYATPPGDFDEFVVGGWQPGEGRRENNIGSLLLGGVPGVPPAHIAILGGGVVGKNAARIAAGWTSSRSRAADERQTTRMVSSPPTVPSTSGHDSPSSADATG